MEFTQDSLITFLHLAAGNTFAATSKHLGVSPSTVSAQITSLESTLKEPLLVRRRGRGGEVSLTAEGREFAVFARPIVAAHQTAVEHFSRDREVGVVRLAIADDIAASTGIGDAIRAFRRRHVASSVEITVGQSGALMRRLRAGQFDLALAKRLPVEDDAIVLRRETICWVVHPDTKAPPAYPLPLIAYPTSSFLRNRAIQRLDEAGIPWRIANAVRGVNGAVTAARGGLGIGVFAEQMIPDDLRPVPPAWNLPALGMVETVIAHRADIADTGRSLLSSLDAWGVDLL